MAEQRSTHAPGLDAAAQLDVAAQRFRLVVRTIRSVLVVVPVLALAGLVLTWGTLYAIGFVLLAVLWAAVAPCLISGLWGTPDEENIGSRLNMVGEPRLYRRMAALTSEMDVRPPSSIRLVPEPVVAVRLRPSDPVLFIGAPLFWHLGVDELERMVARELSLLRSLRGPQRRTTWELVDSVNVGRLYTGLGWHNRWVAVPVRSVLRSRAERLHEAARTLGDVEVPQRLLPRVSDAEHLGDAARAWSTLCDRWVRPALQRRSSVTRLLAASKEVTDRFEADSDEERYWVPAFELLSDPETVDAEFTQWLWNEWGCDTDPLSWDDYPRQVAVTEWRETAFEGARAHLGNPAALIVPSFDELFQSLADRKLPNELVEERGLLEAVVRLGLLELPTTSLTWDWLSGPVLADAEGAIIDVQSVIDQAVRTGEVAQLRWWLHGLGVDPSGPLYRAAPRPSALASPVEFEEVDRTMGEVEERHHVQSA